MLRSSLKNMRWFAQIVFMCGMLIFVCAVSGYAETFVDNKDDTVTDTLTGLMWSKQAAPGRHVQWDQIQGMLSSCSFGGKGGWRLPTKNELVELYSHLSSGSHPFDMRYPSSIPHWSSTVSLYVKEKQYYRNYLVDMNTGEVKTYQREGTYSYVWPVRNAN